MRAVAILVRLVADAAMILYVARDRRGSLPATLKTWTLDSLNRKPANSEAPLIALPAGIASRNTPFAGAAISERSSNVNERFHRRPGTRP